jgi:16S rRNA (guanine966-N2)-methyltransferase
MRIIAGTLGGRNFISPRGNRTHPMSEKVRGALFNALGDIEGLTLLDAFAGSGALSFESISRGAKSVIAIDNDRNAQWAIADNIRSLGLIGNVKLIKASANSWAETTDSIFDIVLLDPPYDAVQDVLLSKLAARVNIDGLVVLSLPPKSAFKLSDNYQLLQTKDYGDATLAFWRRIS